MALVRLSTSRAVVMFKRMEAVQAVGPTVIRWAARIVAVLDLLVLIGWYTNLVVLGHLVRAASFVTLGLALVWLVIDVYQRTKWASLPVLPPLSAATFEKNDLNLADYLDLELVKLLEEAAAQANGQEPNALQCFQAVLTTPVARSVLVRLGVPYDDQSRQLLVSRAGRGGSSTELTALIRDAAKAVIESQLPHIDLGSFLTILAQDPGVKAALFDVHVEPADVTAVVAWQRRLDQFHRHVPAYDQPVGAGIAEDWTAGYTPALNQFSDNWSNQVDPTKPSLVIGRDKELGLLARYLSKTRGQNVLLVGQPGVGRDTLVLGFAQQVAAGAVPDNLRFQQIRVLDTGTLLAGVSDRGTLEARLLRVFGDAARAGNVILYLPNVETLIGGGERVGGVDATDVLMRVLKAASIRIIAATTPADYQNRIAANPTLAGLLDRIDIGDLDKQSTLEVLEDSVFQVENQTNTLFIYSALRTIVEAADRYLHDQPFPEKALDLLSEVANFAAQNNRNWVDPDLVQQALSEKLKMPLQTVQGDERDQLLNLEQQLHQSVIGQDEAITAIASALRRARAGLTTGKRPIASLLFLGPTGVGKTESAKALARVYFGDEDRMVRFDMSEYQQGDGLVKLIGAPNQATGTKSGGYLADAVHDQPFSLVLLDELEKAHPQVLNLFLQVLDDGRMTDGAGRLIDFTNTIIIATSNAGAELIRQSIAQGEADDARRQRLLDYLQQEHIYRPEFLNRFDGVIAFHPLTLENVQAIARLLLGALSQQISSQQQIQVSFSPELIQLVAAGGFDPELGARPLRRFIQDHVESWLANQLISGQLTRGATLIVTPDLVGLAPSVDAVTPKS